jgi:hypothetical protein
LGPIQDRTRSHGDDSLALSKWADRPEPMGAGVFDLVGLVEDDQIWLRGDEQI